MTYVKQDCNVKIAPLIKGVNSLGPPGARKTHAGKYRELTLLRQRGGTERSVPYPLGSFEPIFDSFCEGCINSRILPLQKESKIGQNSPSG